jgi:hypothetical protein
MAEDKKEVTVRNKSDATHVFTDVVAGSVEFKPGETKTFKVSQAAADELEERSDNETDAFELSSKAEAKKAEKVKADAAAKAEEAKAEAAKAEEVAKRVDAGDLDAAKAKSTRR